MNVDSIIFDLDGTLWNTCSGCAIAWNQTLQDQHISRAPITVEDMQSIMGKTVEQIRLLLFPDLTKDHAEDFLQKALQQTNLTLKDGGWQLYSGVAEGLQELAKCSPLFIVSNCQEGYVQSFDHCTGLVTKHIQDFEYIGRTGQPKYRNIQTIAQRNQLKNPIYIGDTQGDQEAAKLAETDFAFVTYGFGSISKASRTFDSFDQVTDFFTA